MPFYIFLFRIIMCFILSLCVGLERQLRHRMVGLRTNVLVSIGAFLFAAVSFSVTTSDQTRIVAQVVSGIGFLGAGVILRDGSKIKGLNTAATLWCVAAIGTLCATGMVAEAAVGTSLVLISNIVLRVLSMGIMDKAKLYQKEKCVINISCEKDIEVVVRTTIAKAIERNSLLLQSLEKTVVTKDKVNLKAIIVTTRYQSVEDIINNISAETGVLAVSFNHTKLLQSEAEDDDED